MDAQQIKTKIETLVKDIHPTEMKLLNEAKHIILAIKDDVEHILNLSNIESVWIPKVEKVIDARDPNARAEREKVTPRVVMASGTADGKAS